MAGTPTSSNAAASSPEGQQKQYTSALYSLFILFFMWGFMTVMNDVLIPHLKKVFELGYFQSMLVQMAFFLAYTVGSLVYFLISITSGDPIQKIGYKNGIVIGLIISALGSALFYPAALGDAYSTYLIALFVLGLGFSMLQIAANPYVAILGKSETASSRLNFAQGFNSLGTTLGPLIGGFLIFKYFAGADAVKYPYLVFALILVLLAGLFWMAKLPKLNQVDNLEKNAGALKFSQLRFGILAIFLYVGGEVAVGSFLINFFGLEQIAGLGENEAKNYLSLYWGGLMIGRFLGAISMGGIQSETKKLLYMFLAAIATFLVIFVANNQSITFGQIAPWLIFIALNYAAFYVGRSVPARTLTIFALSSILLLLITIFANGKVAMWAIIGLGLFNSIMWSNIFTLAIDGLGKYTSQGSSLLVMAIAGGALVPALQGLVADMFATDVNPDAGVQISFIIPVLCYLYILFYGLVGHRKKYTLAD